MKKLLLACSLGFFSFCSTAQTAIDLAGSGNQIDITIPALSEFTVEYDFYMHSLIDWNGGITQTSGSLASPIDFYVDATGAVTFYVDDSFGYSGGSPAGVTLTAGNWYHIAYTVSAGTSVLYIDGVAVYTFGANPDVALSNIIIGDRADGGINADAKFDNIRIWSVVRSATEIANNYNKCLDGTEPNLVVLYDCEEGAGTTLNDLATADGSQNGTVSGPGTWTTGVICCPVEQSIDIADFTSICPVDTVANIAGSELNIGYFLRNDADNAVLSGPFVGTGAALALTVPTVSSTTTHNVLAATQSGSLEFDGVNDYVDVPTFDFSASDQMTVEVWVQPTDITIGAGQAILRQQSATLPDYMLAIQGAGNVLNFSVNTTSGFVGVAVPIEPTYFNDGQWHHIAGVYDGSLLYLYVDGELIGTTPHSGTILNDGYSNLIGNSYIPASEYYRGKVDEVRYWNVARTSTELNSNRVECLDGTETGLVANYSFEDGTGSSVLTDKVGANNGTLMNMDAATDWVEGAYVCGSCALTFADDFTITIDPLVDQSITQSDFTALCQVDTIIGLDGSQNNVAYFLRNNADNSVIEGPLMGTGSAINFGNQTISTTSSYNIYSSPASSSLEFDGVDDYVIMPLMDFSSSDEMTIELWIKTTDVSSNSGYTLTRQEAIGFGPDWLLAFQDFGTTLSFGLRTDVTYSELDASVDPTYFEDGAWHHIAAVYDGANKYIYVDGVQIGMEPRTGNVTNNGNSNVMGRYIIGSDFFEGTMDELRFWNVARTESELSINKIACFDGSEANLIACYSFEDGNGSAIASDKTGSFDGTLTNMDASTDWVEGAYVCANCDLALTDVLTVTIEDLAAQTVATSDFTSYCNADTLIEIDGSQIGANYYLRDDADNSIIAGPVAGTGSALSIATGSVSSTTTFNVYATSQNDKSLALPNTNDYMRVNSPYTTFGSEITVETWVYSPVAGNDVWGGQASTTDDMATNVWMFNENTFYVNDNGTWKGANWTATPIPAGWTHLACVADGSSVRVYFNGVEVSSEAGISSGIQNNPAAILDLGQDPRFAPGTAGRNSDVRFDNFRIWNYARSESEINATMNTCLTGSEAGLVQLMEFNETSGTSVAALTGGEGVIENPSSNRGDGIQSCPLCDLEFLTTVTITIDSETFTPQTNTICEGDSILLGGSYQTMAGTYNDTLTSVFGCDSILVTTLTVNPTLYETLDYTICEGDSLFLGGAYQSITGVYLDTLSSAITGCDSVITSNLLVHPTVYETMDYSICDGDSIFIGGNYQFVSGIYSDTLSSLITGCDSIITSNLTVFDIYNTTFDFDICFGDSLFIGGSYQTTSGVFADTLSSTMGCDSIITTNLTVADPIDISVSLSGITLTASESGIGITYQWINCADETPITGATSQTFTPDVDGDYAVIIENNGCLDTTDCYTVAGVGLNDNSTVEFSIYPNPTNGIVNIIFSHLTDSDIEVYNATGSLVFSTKVQDTNMEIDLSYLTPGMYHILIVGEHKVSTQKLIIN